MVLTPHNNLQHIMPVPFWARGYCVDTVGLDSDKIRKYVKCQKVQEADSSSFLLGVNSNTTPSGA